MPIYEIVNCKDWSEFDYQIEFDDILKATNTTFYNKDGTVNRVQFNVKFWGTATNLETGTVFRDKGSVNGVFYPNGGELVETGLSLNLHYKGMGTVAKVVGKAIFDGVGEVTFESGQNRDKDYRITLCEGLVDL